MTNKVRRYLDLMDESEKLAIYGLSEQEAEIEEELDMLYESMTDDERDEVDRIVIFGEY